MKQNKFSNKITEEDLKIEEEFENNIFYEEFQRVSEGKNTINLKKLLKMDVSNETGDFKINLCHIPTLYFLDSDKDGHFTKKDFINLSKIAEEKEKKYKRYEFTSQLQAHFTLLMSKKVCSEQGEAEFVSWLIKLVTGVLPNNPPLEGVKKNNIGNGNNTNSNILSESEEDEYNPDPSKYVDRSILRTLYDVLNVSTSHKIDFQSFFELMKINSDELEENSEGNEEFVLISVLEFFCKNFIRGFNKLIFDLGLESIIENK
jgi:hypothetical protein